MVPIPHLDEAVEFLVQRLRSVPDLDTPNSRGKRSQQFGCEILISNCIIQYLRLHMPGQHVTLDQATEAVTGVFLDAAWELSRRGVIRPGGVLSVGQLTPAPLADGFSLTSTGRRWVASFESRQMAMLDPGRYASVIEKYAAKFGDGFRRRAFEAEGCYRTLHYVAACAMAGAACESLLLAAAIARTGDEATVLQLYQQSQGRKKLIDRLSAGLPASIASPIQTAAGLLSYWRDEAAHGRGTTIEEFEAHDALSRLLRLAQIVSDGWATILGTPSAGTPRPGRGTAEATMRS